ncbi:hypothetical protein [Paraburkholderia megapolitana]
MVFFSNTQSVEPRVVSAAVAHIVAGDPRPSAETHDDR